MPPKTPEFPNRRRAFTLIELLTVIAIIGILASIIFPTIGAVQSHAHKAAVKAQLGQWTVAMQSFHSDYSYYPPIDGAYAATQGEANIVNPQKFAIALTGVEIDGTVLPANATATDMVGNTKRRNYYSIAQSEQVLTDGTATGLQDAFGNTDFAVLYDSNGDGWIRNDDKVYGGATQSAPTVTAKGGGKYTPDPVLDVNLTPTQGIRAGVIFYTAGPGNPSGAAIDASGAVFSWK
jgi:prepilin-type N-terminal cleavage/methylation domain-containing protein